MFFAAVWLKERWQANQLVGLPLVGLSTGWLVFSEALQPIHFAGGALLMLGLLVNVFGGPWLARLRPAN